MQKILALNLIVISLMGCASSKEANQITTTDQADSVLQEETIPGPTQKPEVRKVKVAKHGLINPTTVANGVVDVMVDGRLESDSLEKENPVDVLIDDAIEKTAEDIDTQKEKPDTIKMPK
jgi:hypothetical protein